MNNVALPAAVESGLNEAGTAVAVIVAPERGAGAVLGYVNQPFAAVMRKGRAQLAGAPFQAILDVVGKAECREGLLQSLRSGTPAEFDVPLMAGGAESWLGLRLSFPPPEPGGERNAIMIGRDITLARRMATQEDRMRQMLAQIFMRIGAPVIIIGRVGELVMSNTAFRHLSGYGAEELKRLRVQDIIPPDFIERCAIAREKQFADGESYEMDFELLGKGGRRVATRLTSMLLSDSDQDYRVVTLIPRGVAIGGHVEAAALTAAVQVYATRDRGDLRAVSLEALRALSGADWERIAVRAMLRAEHTIRKRLGHDDVVSRLDDSSFAVWFSSEDQSRNATMLQAIVRDVRLNFLTEFGEEIASFVSATLVPGVPARPPAPAPAGVSQAVPAAPRITSLRSLATKAAVD